MEDYVPLNLKLSLYFDHNYSKYMIFPTQRHMLTIMAMSSIYSGMQNAVYPKSYIFVTLTNIVLEAIVHFIWALH